MALSSKAKYDIAVIGAGFSGSLTALGLHQIGYKVILIEKGSHPRFAVGESSTPIADMILRDIADRYNLPWLRDFSRYGSWQDSHPEISCGLKRGFSYYRHFRDQKFQTDENHSRELLVAASVDNRRSDTNWYRRDTDAFFVKKVKEAGIAYYDRTETKKLVREGSKWHIKTNQANNSLNLRCNWIIDATGSNNILELLDLPDSSEDLRTRSSALFSHFRGVKPWQKWLLENSVPDKDYPYNPDHSALHHLMDEGWLWMLRFNNGITSAGFVFKGGVRNGHSDPIHMWNTMLDKYPAIAELFSEASLADEPGKYIQTGRLQRKASKAAGEGWAALPHTAGFIDPLHSTGIAHSLAGVERILHAFEVGIHKPDRIAILLHEYEKAVLDELDFIDLLVSGCYRAMPHFELFNIYTMLYFIAAIDYEQKRLRGNFNIEQHQFLSANHGNIPVFTHKLYRELQHITENDTVTDGEVQAFRRSVQEAIEPYNIPGLLRPPIPNMYEHTAASF